MILWMGTHLNIWGVETMMAVELMCGGGDAWLKLASYGTVPWHFP